MSTAFSIGAFAKIISFFKTVGGRLFHWYYAKDRYEAEQKRLAEPYKMKCLQCDGPTQIRGTNPIYASKSDVMVYWCAACKFSFERTFIAIDLNSHKAQ